MNGQVERNHSTVMELVRCIKKEQNLISNLEAIIRAAQQYNKTVHSVTDGKPFEILYNKINHEAVIMNLKYAQNNMLKTQNKGRIEKQFIVGEEIYEKIIGETN